MSSKEKKLIYKKQKITNIKTLSPISKKSRNKIKNNKIIFNALDINEIPNNSFYGEEDDYDSLLYDKPISKDNLFLQINSYSCNYTKYLSKSFDSLINRSIKNKKNFQEENYFNNFIKQSTLNFSFEGSIKWDQVFLDDHPQSILEEEKNKSPDYFNLIKNINIFNLLHKKQLKNLNKSNYDKMNKNIDSDFSLKTIYLIKSKFSRKNKKIKDNNKGKKVYLHNRNNSEIYFDLNQSKSKFLNIEAFSNDNNQTINNLNNTMPKRLKFKMYDAYIMSPSFENNLTEKEKEVIFKDNNIFNSSLQKFNITLNPSLINEKDESVNINNQKKKIKNHSINFNEIINNSNNKKIIANIDNYKSKEENIMPNNMKLKKNEDYGKNKIITQRVILEEEYMVNSRGEKKLLSVRRLEKRNHNDRKSYSDILEGAKPLNYRQSLNNSLFSSIFKERSKEYKRTFLRAIDEDSHNISNIRYYKNNKEEKNNINNPLSKNKTKKINNDNKVKDYELRKEKIYQQNINSELNKELIIKKKLFHNKINIIKDKNINKFNRSNNNNSSRNKNENKITCHTNFLNTNRTSFNYFEDKEKYKIEPNKGIYERISFTKDQPFMIYQNKEPCQNFVINNSQNFPNLVNIVFVNKEEKNKINNKNINIGKNKYLKANKINNPQQLVSCRLKRSNYRFHEIKFISIDNLSGFKSTRNYHHSESNKIINSFNSCYKLNNKEDTNIAYYSSLENMNYEDKYHEFDNYKSPRNISYM